MDGEKELKEEKAKDGRVGYKVLVKGKTLHLSSSPEGPHNSDDSSSGRG